jgi:hypothetical protein
MEQVTRVGIVWVNGQPEELDGSDGRRQPSMGGTSRVSREAQARICERLGVKFPGPTRRSRVLQVRGFEPLTPCLQSTKLVSNNSLENLNY